jgi:TetR/AcrR family transcriptional regulator, copper-responsive repressor
MESGRRPRGRPRRYDPDAALRRARDKFWRAGYAATSLDDLAGAMAMNRPSIYAGFGDKRALYVAAVERYAAESRAWLSGELAKPGPLRERLRALYRDAAAIYRAGGDPPRGCFLVGTAVTEATRDERVRVTVDATFESFTELFTHRFEEAASEGELSRAATPASLAQVATAALNAIALRARTGAKGEVLGSIIDATVDVVCGAD